MGLQQFAVALYLIDQLQQSRHVARIHRVKGKNGIEYQVSLPDTRELQNGSVCWAPNVVIESEDTPLDSPMSTETREAIINGIMAEHEAMMVQGGEYSDGSVSHDGRHLVVQFRSEIFDPVGETEHATPSDA